MSKREERRAKRRHSQTQQTIITVSIIAAAILLLLGILVIPNMIPPNVDVKIPAPVTRPQAQNTAMGDPKAPVKVEEYSDFLCSHCATFAQTLETQIIRDYVATGKVYFVYVPFSFLAPESKTSAEAAYCAMEQGKFWEYHDVLFNNQATIGAGTGFGDSRILTYMAEKIGLDGSKFRSCLDGRKYQQKVLDEVTNGKKNKVEGTPSFLVNGKLVYSNDLVQTIEDALKAK